MNNFKRFCALTAASVMMSVSVYAAESGEITNIRLQASQNSVITLTIDYSASHAGISTVYVIPKADLEAAKGGDMREAVFMGEADLTENASEFSFLMPTGAASGVYVAVSGESDESDIKTRSRYFMYNSSAAAAAEKLSALNSASDFKAALIDGAVDSWYIDTDLNAWKNSQEAVLSLIQSMKGMGFDSTFSVEDAFCVACDVADIENTTVEKVLTDIKCHSAALDCDTNNADFVKNPEQTAEKFKLLAAASKPKTTEDVKKRFREACALACMSNANRTTSIENLKAYNDVFELNFSGDFDKVDRFELAKVFENNDYTTVEQVRDEFNDEVKRLISAQSGTDGGNRGGGGSGGSGGGGAGISNQYSGGGAGLIEQINSVTSIFPDVESGYWAANQIRFVYENHIMSGDADGNFRPEAAITREEWTKVVLSAFAIDLEDSHDCEFSDVDKSEWYYPFVARAYNLGVVNGVDKTNFGIGQSLTRQDAVVMMHRMTEIARDIRAIQPVELTFSDASEISDYALTPVKIFVAMGAVNGYEDGEFKPNGSITRAEAAKIICSLLDKLDVREDWTE